MRHSVVLVPVGPDVNRILMTTLGNSEAVDESGRQGLILAPVISVCGTHPAISIIDILYTL